jgi:sugar phosphate isomerase/epimerase
VTEVKFQMIGLSTAWLTERDGIRGAEIVEEIIGLGFKAVELEYRVRESTFREMSPLIAREDLRVLSIHNFFPLPDGILLSQASGDRYLLSSPDRIERDRAMAHTIHTIESAANAGARAVVLHLGRVEMDAESDRLYELFRNHQLRSPEGRRFLERKLRERRAKRDPYLQSTLRSLDRLNKEAEKRGVLLGVENRYHYHQIPDFEEIGRILDAFSGGSVFYWHDMGHAHVQENMGLIRPGALLHSYGTRTLGLHIHDALGMDDHRAPGLGEIDFENLKKHLDGSQINILEVHQKSDRRQLLRGLHVVEGIGLARREDP